jgi:hypothetical protein
MSYQDLPDPRPLGARLALGSMPRRVAIAVSSAPIGLGLAGLAAMWLDPGHPIAWGLLTILGLVFGWHYISAIRWSDFHKMWPARRSRRRTRPIRPSRQCRITPGIEPADRPRSHSSRLSGPAR